MTDLDFLKDLSGYFEKLPGVGSKTGMRYAYSIIEKMSKEEVERFAETMVKIKREIKKCPLCGLYTLNDKCDICSDVSRNQNQIMVVKNSRDVYAIEKTNQYHGVYHILEGLISPLDGIGPEKLNIETLEQRVKNGYKEIILATSFTMQGETTALYLEKILKSPEVIITRIGYGLPAGTDMEYIDELTLKYALEGRKRS